MDDIRKRDYQSLAQAQANEPGLKPVSARNTGQNDATLISKNQLSSQGELNSTALVGTLWADKYHLIEVLGEGGMGIVFKARNRINGQIRAVKILKPDLILDSDALRRFQQEAKAAARLMHPNVIQVIDDGVGLNGTPYIVMEYAEGDSLAAIIKKEGRLPILIALRIFSQICQALKVAHANNVIHRDIKPSNVLLLDMPDEPYFVKVLDFGIAKVLPRADDGTIAVTATGAVIGSPPYMSPEQCLGTELDHRSDLYSFGCLMYEVLSGKPPLLGDNQMGTMYKQINELAEPLIVLNEDVRLVQECDRIIRKTMEKSPDRRYSTASELENDLHYAIQRSSKGSTLLAALELRLRYVSQEIVNRLGTSRKVILPMVLLFAIAVIPFSYFVAPYVFVRLPKGGELNLAWKASPFWSNATFESRAKGMKIEARLKGIINTPNVSYEEQSAAYHQLADWYFDDGRYDEAAVRYEQLARLATKRLHNSSHVEAELSSIMHETAYSLCRFARCVLHKQSFQLASNKAKMAIKLTPYDSTGDSKYQIYLAYVLGVSDVNLAGKSSPVTNDYFEKFIDFIEQKGYTPERTSEIAQCFADIADSYYLSGQREKAITTYRKAKRYWVELEDPGSYNRPSTSDEPHMRKRDDLAQYVRFKNEHQANIFSRQGDFAVYNVAVADTKIGMSECKMKNWSAARASFDAALVSLKTWTGEKRSEQVAVLLQVAELEWQTRHYLSWWLARCEATAIIKAKSRNE